METATAGYLIPSNRTGGVVLFVDRDFRSLHKVVGARGGGFIIEHVVDLTRASILELSAQLLLRVSWLIIRRLVEQELKEADLSQRVCALFVQKLGQWVDGLLPQGTLRSPLLRGDKKVFTELCRSRRRRFGDWVRLHPSQLALFLKQVPVGADLEALTASPGQVWNAFNLGRHANGQSLPRGLASRLPGQGYSAIPVHWLVTGVVDGFPRPFTVPVDNYSQDLYSVKVKNGSEPAFPILEMMPAGPGEVAMDAEAQVGLGGLPQVGGGQPQGDQPGGGQVEQAREVQIGSPRPAVSSIFLLFIYCFCLCFILVLIVYFLFF